MYFILLFCFQRIFCLFMSLCLLPLSFICLTPKKCNWKITMMQTCRVSVSLEDIFTCILLMSYAYTDIPFKKDESDVCTQTATWFKPHQEKLHTLMDLPYFQNTNTHTNTDTHLCQTCTGTMTKSISANVTLLCNFIKTFVCFSIGYHIHLFNPALNLCVCTWS